MASAGVALNRALKLYNTPLQCRYHVATLLDLSVVFQVSWLKILAQFFVPVQIHLNNTSQVIIYLLHQREGIIIWDANLWNQVIQAFSKVFVSCQGIRIMEETIKKIITRFKEHDPLGYDKNKQNHYKNQIQGLSCLDESQKPIKRIHKLETIINSLITEANSVFRYYQEALREAIEKQQHLREEISLCKANTHQDQQEAEAQLKDFNQKIQQLNQELNLKSIQYHDLLEKYEDYQQHISQTRAENEDKLRAIVDSMSKQMQIRDQKVQALQEQLRRVKYILSEEIRIREEVLLNNCELRKINDDLRLSLQLIQKKMHSQEKSHLKRAWSPQKDDDLLQCQVISRQRYQDEVFTFEEVKMNDSQELQTHTAKEVLDLSQHYSKFNRTEEFLSKQKPSSLLDMNSNQSKPFGVRRNLQKTANKRVRQNNNSVYLQIATIQSRDQVIHLQSLKSKNTQQIKQFSMPQRDEVESDVDPYRAFFALMVQCQKMNSPNFNRICGQDLNYLYDYFLSQCIPYNQWQKQIRKRLKQAAPQQLP